MKAILLARVSTEEQKEDGHSLPAQVRSGHTWCKHKHLTIWKEFQFDESSTKDHRKKFKEIITIIETSDERVALVVETIDRLQRSFKESILLLDLIKADKVEVHFIRENLIINKESNSSEFLRWDMGVMFARGYVLQLSDNVKRSRMEKLRRGEWPGMAPFGYINSQKADGSRWIVPDPERAHWLVKIFEMYSHGNTSIKKISEYLNENGVTTRKGNRLSKSAIHTMIKNSFYYGMMVSNGRSYRHNYAPLIDENLFMSCQNVRESHKKKKVKYANIKFLFGKGLLHCKDCGAVITAEEKRKPSGKTYVYYSCTGSRGCKRQYVSEKAILKKVEQLLKKIQQPPEVADLIVEALRDANSGRKEFCEQDRNFKSLKWILCVTPM